MNIKGIVWLGTRTDHFEQMTAFCRDTLGLSQTSIEPGFAVFDLPNGDLFEVFGPQQSFNTFMTHPVAGFLVDDIAPAPKWKKRESNSSAQLKEILMTTNGHTFAPQTGLCTN